MKHPATYHRPMGHTAYHHVGHTAYHHVGQVSREGVGGSTVATGLGWAGIAAGAFHGYRRNQSVGWAIGWALAGGFFPLITTGIALAQGFGKKKGR